MAVITCSKRIFFEVCRRQVRIEDGWFRVTTAIIFFAVACPARADSWPNYLNGADRTGNSHAGLSAELQPSWVYKSPAKPRIAWAGPRSAPIEGHEMRHRVDFDSSMQVVVISNRLYFGSTVDNKLYCVNANTGKPIWTFHTDGAIRLAPSLAFNKVYFGSDDGWVYCVEQISGELVWKMRVGPKDDRLLARGEMISRWPVRTGVLIDGEIAYFGAGVFPHENVFLCAVRAKTGEVIWRNDTISQQDAGRNDLSPQGYLLANEDTLFVPSGRSLPVAISKETGEIIFQRKYSWRTDAGGVVGGTKALLGDGQVYSGGPHHFLAMDQETGEVGESWIGGRQMVLAEDYAFLVDGEKVFCVNRQEHARASQEKQKWFLRARENRSDPKKVAEAQEKMREYAGIGVLWQVPCAFDGALIATQDFVVVGGPNEVWMLDRNSGALQWKASVEGKVTGLAATDHILVASTDSGHIYAYSDQSNRNEPIQWPAPAVAAFDEDAESEMFRRAASEILESSAQRSGFCLVLGNEQGRLAAELAAQSDLTIFAAEADAEKARAAREHLDRAGIHGSRVTVFHGPLDDLPFSNYFANLVVSESHLRTGELPLSADKMARFVKPCGGTVVLGSPRTAPDEATESWLAELLRGSGGELSQREHWYCYKRGQLPGAGEWSHQYGNVANTSMSNDQRVRDGLSVLWYGDPGPSSMINRHEAAGAPLSTNGKMFIQGVDSVMAYDAYNGNYLWEFENPGAIRTGVFNNRETHNLAASSQSLFVAIEDQCSELDAETGESIHSYQTPASEDGLPRAWAYVAYDDQQLFGTSTIRKELEQKLRRRGLTVTSQTDAIFAFDTESKQRSWIYRGKNILHTTIAIGPERVYFIDSSLTPDQRQALYLSDKQEYKKLTGDAALQAEKEMKEHDLRLAVAIDRKTGKKVWERAVDVTDTTDVSAGGGSLTVMYANDHLVLCGANANGHYWKQFLSGQFEKRKLVVLDAKTGDELWAKNANYMNRPAVIGDEIYAEPWAFNLHSGEPKKREHPVTGEESTWRFSRPGHHCGVITATPNMMFFRSGFIGYYDLYRDSGTKHFAGQRLGCWVNAIPGNGLVMIPEASAGCVCQFSIASTVVLEPVAESKSWGIFSAVGDAVPVRRLAVNLGAPGDHMDEERREWFGFPRPSSRGRLEYEMDIEPEFLDGGGWVNHNQEDIAYSKCERPWLFASGARGLERFSVQVQKAEADRGEFSIDLLFRGIDEDEARKLVIESEGRPLQATIQALELERIAGEAAMLLRVSASAKEKLELEIQYPELTSLPILSGIEVTKETEVARETAGSNKE